jgi:rod shape-determining protein MreD
MSTRVQVEQHIEVHKFYGGTVAIVAFLALVVQAFLHKFGGKAEYVELPLLVTMYFGLSRRNPVSGLLLGTVIGLLQDGLSNMPIGIYGIAKTMVGYVASTIGARIDVEHPLSRFAFTFIFFHFHQVILATTEWLLLAEKPLYFNGKLLAASLINSIVAVLLFPLLDYLRKPS